MTLSLNYSKIKPLVTDNCLILTPNARTQQAIYAGQVLDKPLESVTRPVAVRSFTQWQKELWSELSFHQIPPKLITKSVLKLWIENVISNESNWNLTNESGVANKVVEAFQSSVAWSLTLEDINQPNGSEQSGVYQQPSVEVDYFIKWINEYKILAKSKKIICTFEILKYLLDNINNLYQHLSKEVLPDKLLLVGFNQLTPLEEMFINQLNALGTEIEFFNYEKHYRHIQLLEFDCFEDEIEFAAFTAKQKIEKNKNKNIAIVVNQLSDHLPVVYDAFSQIFQPEEIKPWISLSKPPYNVSAGFSIAEQPIVQAGYLLLNLRKKRVTLEELHFIKNTPFIQWGNEKAVTHYFLHKICLKPRKQYSVKYLISEIERIECSELLLTKLKLRLNALDNKSTKVDSIKNYQDQWIETLRLWGWGVNYEEHIFTPTEHRACNEYLQIIHSTYEINHLFDKVSEKVALQYVNQTATQKSFQLPSDRSQIHVLGVLEATGLEFSDLILVGFNSTNWPMSNKPNPFLPSDLQRRLKMPGGSAEREYEYTKSLSDTLMNSSDDLVVTSSDENNSSESSISSLFFNQEESLSCIQKMPSTLVSENKYQNNIAQYKWIVNSNMLVDKERLHGGTGFLSRYANCPFSAFFVNYLKVTNFETLESGIDARQRGVWLHDAMQLIWEELQSQENLLKLEGESLIEIIEEKLQSKLNEIKNILLLSVNESIINLEKEKLTNLIFDWLFVEKKRGDFSVKSLEEDVELNLEGVNFTFRLDRIDSNKHGFLEIIDYKTGKVQINDWFSVRPIEAQMPAYMLALEGENISAIDYARIRKGEVAQLGLSFDLSSADGQLAESEKILKFENYLSNQGDGNVDVEFKYSKLKEKSVNPKRVFDCDELKVQWRQTLERIAYGMSEGFSPVSPKDINQSCTYCECRSICRIDERQPDIIDQNSIESIDLLQELSQ